VTLCLHKPEPRDILIDLDGTGADGAGQQAV
jgi:hypothetical protein